MSVKPTGIWTKAFIFAVGANFFLVLTSNMLASTITIYAKGLTSSDALAGITVSVYTLTALGVRILGANIFDKISMRKMLMIGITIIGIASASYLLADNAAMLIFSRLLHGVGGGLASTAAATVVSNSIPRHKLLEGLGYNSMMTTLTTAIGPAIVLTMTHSDYRLFNSVFYLMIGCCVGAFLFATQTGEGDKRNIDPTICLQEHNIKLATVLLTVMMFFLTCSQSAVMSFISLYALERNWGNITLFFTVFACCNFATRFFMGKITSIFSERFLMAFSVLTFAATLAGIAKAPNLVTVCILAVPYGISMGFLYPMYNASILRTMDALHQGLGNTIYLSSMDIGFATGAFIWGVVAQGTGSYQGGYFCAAGLMICSAVLLYLYPRILNHFHASPLVHVEE